MNDFLNEISPVELNNGIYVKRNDKLNIYDVNGGKSQGAYFLIKKVIYFGLLEDSRCENRFFYKFY